MEVVEKELSIDLGIRRCKSCGASVSCSSHSDAKMDEYGDEDEGYYYSCGGCVAEGTALGSIVHWCDDAFGLIGGEHQKEINGDGREIVHAPKLIEIGTDEIVALLKGAKRE